MAYAVVLVFEDVTEDHYWAVNDKLGIAKGSSDGYPNGLLVHTGGPTPTGWLVSEVWDSKSSQEAFMAGHLGEALASVGVPPPSQVLETETVNLQQF